MNTRLDYCLISTCNF